jgi:hypothetical protein
LLSAHSFLILSALCSMFVVHEIDETNEMKQISCFRTYVPSEHLDFRKGVIIVSDHRIFTKLIL